MQPVTKCTLALLVGLHWNVPFPTGRRKKKTIGNLVSLHCTSIVGKERKERRGGMDAFMGKKVLQI